MIVTYIAPYTYNTYAKYLECILCEVLRIRILKIRYVKYIEYMNKLNTCNINRTTWILTSIHTLLSNLSDNVHIQLRGSLVKQLKSFYHISVRVYRVWLCRHITVQVATKLMKTK